MFYKNKIFKLNCIIYICTFFLFLSINGQSKKDLLLQVNRLKNDSALIALEFDVINKKNLVLSLELDANAKKILRSDSIVFSNKGIIDKLLIRNKLLQDSIYKLLSILSNYEKKIFIDIDGNEYHLLKLNGKNWLSSALKVTSFNDGFKIVKSNSPDEFIKYTENGIATFCYLDFKDSNKNKGLYYNEICLKTYNRLAPIGSRIPTNLEFLKEGISDGEFNQYESNKDLATQLLDKNSYLFVGCLNNNSECRSDFKDVIYDNFISANKLPLTKSVMSSIFWIYHIDPQIIFPSQGIVIDDHIEYLSKDWPRKSCIGLRVFCVIDDLSKSIEDKDPYNYLKQ